MPTTDALDSKLSTARPRYDEYEESGADWLGEIPAHWERIRLKFLADFTGGGTPSKDNQEYWDGSIPWVSPKDMKAGRVTETQDYITPEAVVESSTKLVDPGSVLIVVRSGILKHTIPVATNEVEVALNQDLKAITPDDSLRSRYLAYLIEGRNDTLLLKWTKSGTTVESLEQRRISNTEIPVPPPEEQHAIATYLDRETERIDALIEKKEQLIDLLEEKRKSLISRVVTKGLDNDVEMQDSGVEWLGEIPAHWETGKLKHLCQEIKDGLHHTPPKVNEEEGIPFISTQHVRNREIDLENATYISKEDYEEGHPTVAPEPGDVLITLVGSIGHAAILTTDKHPISSTRHVGYVRPSGKLNAQYLLNYTESSAFERFIGFETSQVAQPSIYLNSLGNHTIPVPPVEEQKRIANTLQRRTAQLNDLIGKVEDGIECLREYRSSLISAAVTGQIDVRETTEKPVSHNRS